MLRIQRIPEVLLTVKPKARKRLTVTGERHAAQGRIIMPGIFHHACSRVSEGMAAPAIGSVHIRMPDDFCHERPVYHREARFKGGFFALGTGNAEIVALTKPAR